MTNSIIKYPWTLIKFGLKSAGLRLSRLSRVSDRYFIADMVTAYLSQRHQRFVVIEGGARESFTVKRWKGINADQLTLYGFEVDSDECNRLNETTARLGLDFHFYPYGLWGRKGRLPFYVTQERGGCSFYSPNEKLIKRWSYWQDKTFENMLSVEKVIEVDVTTVESWQKENNVLDIDFIKLNVQGAELEVLQGAATSLDNVLGLEIEMSFSQTYLGAPLFADIDKFLRSKDFSFFDCLAPNYAGRVKSPAKVYVSQEIRPFRRPSRQFFEGHFLYLKDPIDIVNRGGDLSHFSTVKMLKLAAFSEMWGQVEYAFEIIGWLIENLKESGDMDEAKEISSRVFEPAASKYLKVIGR